MEIKLTADFDSVEQAERAANRLRASIDIQGGITIESRKVKKDIDTPFMLPYAPQSGLDPWIMLPASYGYPTDSGYLENNRAVSCKLKLDDETQAEQARSVLFNCGASGVNIAR